MKEYKCCGCSACYTICPKNAIEMKLDEYGFYKCFINQEICNNCNLCNDVCIFSNSDNGLELANKGLYSSYSLNSSIREKSSSGGVAYEILLKYIDKYKICSVIYDKNNKHAKHKIFNSKKDIEETQGSKYIQSFNAEAFKEIIKNPNENYIIFGTPCQISGIDAVLKKKKIRNKSILIDIFCHGVPSYNLWFRYLEHLDLKYKIGSNPKVCFRDKKYSWHNYYIHIKGQNEYIKDKENDLFLNIFTKGICNLKECFTCKFRNNSYADLRLGDFWGKRYQNNEEGWSMICINTEIGENLIKSIDNIYLEKVSIKERFSQQTKDYKIPYKYIRGLDMLKQNNIKLKKLLTINPIYYLNKLKRIIKS